MLAVADKITERGMVDWGREDAHHVMVVDAKEGVVYKMDVVVTGGTLDMMGGLTNTRHRRRSRRTKTAVTTISETTDS